MAKFITRKLFFIKTSTRKIFEVFAEDITEATIKASEYLKNKPIGDRAETIEEIRESGELVIKVSDLILKPNDLDS